MSSHLSEEQLAAWISGQRDAATGQHLNGCQQCAAEVERTESALLLFRDSGTRIAEHWRAQPTLQRIPGGVKWAVAGAIFATVLLAVVILRRPLTAPEAAPQQALQKVFMRIPYVVPPAPYERTEVMHMDVPVAALIAAGFRMDTAKAADSVSTDVLVGQDGRPLAISFPENKND